MENDDNQHVYSQQQQSYKSKETSVVSSAVNKDELCDYGYIFDKKSRRCVGNYFISNNIFGFCVMK